jgi:hypothetical protein
MATFAVAGTVDVVTFTQGAPRVEGTRFAAFVRNHTGGGGLSQSVLTPTLFSSVPDGNLLILGGAWDNLAGTNIDPQIASIAKPPGEPAEWTILPAEGQGPTTAAAAIIQQVAYIRPETVWPQGFVVTMTLTDTAPASSVAIMEFTNIAATHTAYSVGKGLGNANTPATLSEAQMPLDGIAIGLYSSETTGASNVDADLDGGIRWSTTIVMGAGGNARMEAQWKSIYVPHVAQFSRSRAGTEDVINGLITFAVQPVRAISAAGTVPVGIVVTGDPFSTGGCEWPALWETVWCTPSGAQTHQASGSVDVLTLTSGDATVSVPGGVTHVIEAVEWDYALLAGG